MNAKIVVVGSFNVDITCYAPRLPRHGETVFGSSVNMTAGGKGFNQVAAASHAGGDVTMIAKIGDDALSQIALKYFEKEKISTEFLQTVKDTNTGSAFIEVDEETGENRIVVISGANGLVDREDVLAAEEKIKECDIALTQLETGIESVKALVELANRHNKPVILNPAPFKALPDELLKGVTLFTPNETEAEFYSGIPVNTEEDAKAAAKEILKKGPKGVIITLGKKGALYMTETEYGLVTAPVVKAVDTTGAGDAFNGALATRLSLGDSLPEAVRFANHFAALSVTKKGACDAMPTKEETEVFLKNS